MSVAAELLRKLHALGVDATAVVADSRQVQPGDLFLAYPGEYADGRRFIRDAVARGAAAVFWEQEAAGEIDRDALNVPNIPVSGLHKLAGNIAHIVYGEPSERMSLIAVTGTNGKTSCTQWIARSHPRRCAIIGTLGAGYPDALNVTGFTTPLATTLARCLSEFVADSAAACALEASSIGIAEGRMNGAHVDIAVFTNLTRDHLDYHGTIEAYAAEKERLFLWPGLRAAVINLDDSFGRHLADVTPARFKIGYALSDAETHRTAAKKVDMLLVAHDIRPGVQGLRFTLQAPQGDCNIESRIAGNFNVANLLAVAGTLLAAGLPFEQLAARLSELTPPPGRMQRMGGNAQPLVVIDYSHTPDALANALTALRDEATARKGQLVCVFGCGGDRDAGKRPQMGELAQHLADRVLLTSDNPRSESPSAIIDDILVGAPGTRVILDRREAIAQVLAEAQPADVVLLAGKGHEDYQEIAGTFHPFSDFAEAEKALASYSNIGRKAGT